MQHPATPGGRVGKAGLCDSHWALVMIYSMLVALASNIPQITVKAFILRRYGHGAFFVNGSLESLRALCAFFSQPILGVLSDRYGRRLPLCCCAVGLCIPHAILALGAIDVLQSVFLPWSIFYVLCGTFKGSDAMVAAYIVDLVAPIHRASALGINLALTFGLSGAVGNVVGAFTTSNFGAGTTFAMPVGLALINAVFVWRVLPESMPEGVLLHQVTRSTPPMLRATPPLVRPTGPSELREHDLREHDRKLVHREVVREVIREDERRGEPSEALGGGIGCCSGCRHCCHQGGALDLVFAGFRLLRQDKTNTLWRLCAATFCAYFVFFGFICNYQIFLQTALHVMPTESAAYIASFSLFSLCTKSSIMPLRQVASRTRASRSSRSSATAVLAASSPASSPAIHCSDRVTPPCRSGCRCTRSSPSAHSYNSASPPLRSAQRCSPPLGPRRRA